MDFPQGQQIKILEHVRTYSLATGYSEANSLIYRIFITSGEIVQATGESWNKRFESVSEELRRLYNERVLSKGRKRADAIEVLSEFQRRLDAELAKSK